LGRSSVTAPARRAASSNGFCQPAADQAEIREEILHLAPLVEADRADEPIRDATEAESFFQRPGLRVRAVEDRHALIGDIVFRGAAGELGGQPLGLVPLVGGAQQDHRLPALFLREERLAESRRILGDDAVRGIQDDLGGAVVLLEPHELGAGEIVLKREHVPHVGTAPTVDRLIVVAHDAEIPVSLGQLLHKQILSGVRVLELVHEHVLEPVLPIREPLRMFAEQRQGMQQQVIEVHRVGLLERGAERGEDLSGDLHERRVGLLPQLLGGEHPILGTRDHRVDGARRVDLGGQLPRFEQALDQGFRVVCVVDGEVRPEPQQGRFAAQQPSRQRMECADPESPRVPTQQLGDARAHFAGCLVRECHGEDSLRCHAELRDQMCDSRGQHARLSRAGACQDQQRPAGMLDRVPLRGIQRQWMRRGHVVSGNSSTNTEPRPSAPGRKVTRPPCCCSTIRRARASPIPQPPVLLETPGSKS